MHYAKLAIACRSFSSGTMKLRKASLTALVTCRHWCQVPRSLAMASGQPLSRLGRLINKSTNSDTFINSDTEQQTLWNSLFIWIVFEVYFSCDIFRSLWSIVLSERRAAAGPRPAQPRQSGVKNDLNLKMIWYGNIFWQFVDIRRTAEHLWTCSDTAADTLF